MISLFYYVLIIFSITKSIEAFVVAANCDKDFTILDLENTQFQKENNDYTKLCVSENKKDILKTWSSACLEIRSTKKCSILESSNADGLNDQKEKSTNFMNLMERGIQKISSWTTGETDNQCHEFVFLPLFKNYYIGIETEGKLDVKLHFEYIDYKLATVFCIGLILFFFAKRISKNEFFHYFTGTSIGVIGSVLIVLFLIFKYIPKKTTAAVIFLCGSSVFFYTIKYFYYHFKYVIDSYQMYILTYIISCAFISWAYCYYRGPIRNEKALNIIKIFLEIVGVLFMYMGTSVKEISLIIMFLLYGVKLLCMILRLQMFATLRYKLFPPKRRLLTSDEYMREGQDYTLQALKELREFCKSPNCDSWKTLRKVKRPERLARFVDSGEAHLTDDEVADYENYTISNDLIDDDLDEN